MSGRNPHTEVRHSTAFSIPDLRELRKSRQSKRHSSRMLMLDRPKRYETVQAEPEIKSEMPIYLYMQLRGMANLPERCDLKLQLEESDIQLTRLTDRLPKQKYINVGNLGEEMPTFSMMLAQDCLQELNSICDSPLRITLYEHAKPKDHKEDELKPHLQWEDKTEESEDDLHPVAVGYIDLLQFFSKKRHFTELKTFLYPVAGPDVPNTLGTTIAMWHVYTLLPLLKSLTFCNLSYLIFESIYNFPPQLADDCENLSVIVSLQVKQGGNIRLSKNAPRRVRLCSFNGFSKTIIAQQTLTHKWESLKFDNKQFLQHDASLGLQTDFRLRLHKLFSNLLGTADVDFGFDDINKEADYALVCNSLHRFVLDKRTSRTLEELIAFDAYEMAFDFFHLDKPDPVMQGTLDLAVFLYPRVNACRFAVHLKPLRIPKFAAAATSKRSSLASQASLESERPEKEKPMFCIMSICLVNPITDPPEDLSIMNENGLNADNLKSCIPIAKKEYPKTPTDLCRESYRNFDQLIYYLTKFVVNEPGQIFGEGKLGLRCDQPNMVNSLIKLVACDFNRRFTTKTNLEFTNLMTTVYRELEQRIADFLLNWEIKQKVYDIGEETRKRIMDFLNLFKCLREVGDYTMAMFFYDKLIKEFPENLLLEFYIFLCNVEWQKLGDAKAYLDTPPNKRLVGVEFECRLVRIYIDFLTESEIPETTDTAKEHLFRALEDFSHRYDNDIDGWILLYCAYAQSKYSAGQEYCRWHYENLYTQTRRPHPEGLPNTRWVVYNSYGMSFATEKLRQFYETFKFLITFGLYKFAEMVFGELALSCTEMEQYIINSTFQVLLNDIEEDAVLQTFIIDEEEPNAVELTLIIAQLNGSIEYARSEMEAALPYYQQLLDIPLPDNMNVTTIQLGLLRYVYLQYEMGDCERAVQALEKSAQRQNHAYIMIQFLMAKSLYKNNRLLAALECFVECTKFKMHIPNVWGYLALINLKRGNNFQAIECWKYARLDPTVAIAEEIITELNNINHTDISLYIDKPSQK